MENGMATIIATVATPYILDKLKLDKSLYGIIFGCILTWVSKIDFNNYLNFNIVSKETIIFCILLFLIYYYNSQILEFITKFFNKKYAYIKLYNCADMMILLQYISIYKNFYENATKLEYGHQKILYDINIHGRILNLGELERTIDDYKNYFLDINFNINGYYVWKNNLLEIKKVDIDKKEVINTIQCPYIILYIEEKSILAITDYFKKIVEKVEEYNNVNIESYYYKLVSEDEKVSPTRMKIYAGPKQSIDQLESVHINSFFHKDKLKLWKIMKDIEFNPNSFFKLGQYPRISLLAYGPPGTGKSSFAYRIAMALNRDLISIDLRIMKKREIYQLLFENTFPSGEIFKKKVVYIFDEFDLTVKELHERKNRNCTQMEIYRIFMKKKMEHELSKVKSTNNDNSEIKKKDEKVSGFYTDNDFPVVEDLLEIIQGPCPLNDSIIIATTNHYDEIYNLCPALFRDGRFTPIYFGYVNKKIVSEMSLYYYKKEYIITDEIEENKISPCTLIKIITESKIIIDIDPYNYFVEKLEILIK
jgi:shikimate kinase